jgi:gamma-glutamyltranspeptidase/glutathione hydrolase
MSGPGQAPSRGDTTYFSVADKDGMMVSMIQSNFRGMGSGLVPDGLGFMLQDRGQLFSLQEGHPNVYRPGKRPFQTIIPGFATRGGAPWMSFGVMGGDMQPQGQAQIIVNCTDYGLDAQAAGDSPRWHHEGSSEAMGEDDPELDARGLLRLENGVPQATRRALAGMGWRIGESDAGFGRYKCVEHRMSGNERVWGAQRPRDDGLARWPTEPKNWNGVRSGLRRKLREGTRTDTPEPTSTPALGGLMAARERARTLSL